MSGPEYERAISELPSVADVQKEGRIVNAGFVLQAAAIRSILYVILAGISVYIASVTAGDTQQTAIYKGLGAAVAMGMLRLGGEGGYDAVRAAGNAINKGDVAAYSLPIHHGQQGEQAFSLGTVAQAPAQTLYSRAYAPLPGSPMLADDIPPRQMTPAFSQEVQGLPMHMQGPFGTVTGWGMPGDYPEQTEQTSPHDHTEQMRHAGVPLDHPEQTEPEQTAAAPAPRRGPQLPKR
jgi:hypothetical protein